MSLLFLVSNTTNNEPSHIFLFLKKLTDSSLFVHYYPEDHDQQEAELSIHYAIPPHWHTAVERDPALEELIMVGTSMTEPECLDGWCGLKDTVKWFGPGKEGVTITTGYKAADEDVTMTATSPTGYEL
jgi:hypothetical protein